MLLSLLSSIGDSMLALLARVDGIATMSTIVAASENDASLHQNGDSAYDILTFLQGTSFDDAEALTGPRVVSPAHSQEGGTVLSVGRPSCPS